MNIKNSSIEYINLLKNNEINKNNLKYPCIICNLEFDTDALNNYNIIFKHLAEDHKLIISNTNQIFNIPSYINYWRKRLTENISLIDICSVIKTNTKSTDLFPSEIFFILSDILPEEKQLRENLRYEELQRALIHQEMEWSDVNTINICLFCSQEFKGKKLNLFKHMEEVHNFYIDAFENLVFTNELLGILKEKLQNLICIYCEKKFKSGPILKEHMRKKRHRRLRKLNHKYFKYFIHKYLPPPSSDNKSDESDDSKDFDDSNEYINANELNMQKKLRKQENEWLDWAEEETSSYVCLFCSFQGNRILDHIMENHRFNLKSIVDDKSLTDYQIIKMINFIRRQTSQNTCFSCYQSFNNNDLLGIHFNSSKHSCVTPEILDYNQPQYFFPTYEDDNLLCLVMSLRTFKREDQNEEHNNDIAEHTVFGNIL